jgi:hypothetical protein
MWAAAYLYTSGGLVKHVGAWILMVAASYAHADCQESWLEYRSSTSYVSVDYSEGCYQGKLILNFSKVGKTGPKRPDPSLHLKSIPFDRECRLKKKDSNGEVVEFSCRNDGVSPLAGATYRYKEFKTTIRCDGTDVPDIEHAFICVSGCGPTTPKKLHVPFGEGCA